MSLPFAWRRATSIPRKVLSPASAPGFFSRAPRVRQPGSIAAARTLSLKAIYQDGEDRAYETFRKLRWSETTGEPVCPRCGSLDHYAIPTRRKFKCAAKGCRHQFSVTSGTIFASRKMAFVDLLGAICIFVNGVKGIAACQLSRDLDCQYKTAFVLLHKLREALAKEVAGAELDGEVEIDGSYYGGDVSPEVHPAMARVRASFEPVWLGGAS